MGRPRDEFCKIQPSFVRNNRAFRILSPEAKLVYLMMWVDGFDARCDFIADDDLTHGKLSFETGIDARKISLIFREIAKLTPLLTQDLTQGKNVYKIRGLRKIHRNFRGFDAKFDAGFDADLSAEKENRKRIEEKENTPTPNGVAVYCEVWKEVFGTKPPTIDGKNAKACKALLAWAKTPEKLRSLITNFFKTDDKFIRQRGYQAVDLLGKEPLYEKGGPSAPNDYVPGDELALGGEGF